LAADWCRGIGARIPTARSGCRRRPRNLRTEATLEGALCDGSFPFVASAIILGRSRATSAISRWAYDAMQGDGCRRRGVHDPARRTGDAAVGAESAVCAWPLPADISEKVFPDAGRGVARVSTSARGAARIVEIPEARAPARGLVISTTKARRFALDRLQESNDSTAVRTVLAGALIPGRCRTARQAIPPLVQRPGNGVVQIVDVIIAPESLAPRRSSGQATVLA